MMRRLEIPGCPTFEHWLECRLYRPFLIALARIGFITVPENGYVRLDADTILRRIPDGKAFFGPAFCRRRWAEGAQVFPRALWRDIICHHQPLWNQYLGK